MNRLNSIFSSFRLPNIPRPSRDLPCEAIHEFYFLCGHTVTSRHCRNSVRLWLNNEYHSAATACDETCPTRNLPTLMHMELDCAWCRGQPPEPRYMRSDPGFDRLDDAEIKIRQDFYLNQIRPVLLDATRNQYFGNVGSLARWGTYKRVEHEIADSLGVGWRERVFFLDGGHDVRLYIPLDPSTIPDNENGKCHICGDSLREGATPIALPCDVRHHYHMECVNQWISNPLTPPGNNPNGRPKHTCPSCRAVFKILKYEEWERMEGDRSFVDFFVTPRAVPPPFNPNIDGVDGTRARRQEIEEALNAFEAQQLQDQLDEQDN